MLQARFFLKSPLELLSHLKSSTIHQLVISMEIFRECDSARLKDRTEFASYEFLSVTTQTVIDSVTDLSKATCANSIRSHSD